MKNLVVRTGVTWTLMAAVVGLATACSSGDTATPPYTGSGASGAGTTTTTTTTSMTTTTGNTAGGTAMTSSGATGTAGAGATTGTTTTTTTTTTTGGAAGSTTGGAAGGGGAAASGPATFTAVLKIFTDANCGLCHGMATLGGGLIFKPTDAMGTYTALVGPVSAGTNSSMCAGKTYVVPGNPDGSLLYNKLEPMPPCGARMPGTGVFFTDDQLKTVHDWIMAGAMNN